MKVKERERKIVGNLKTKMNVWWMKNKFCKIDMIYLMTREKMIVSYI